MPGSRPAARPGRVRGAIVFGPGGRTAWVVCAPFTAKGESGAFDGGTVVPVRTAAGTAGRAVRVRRGPMAIAIVR